MKSEKLSRLFSAISNPANNQEVRKSESTKITEGVKQNADAVSVSLSNSASTQKSLDSEQAAKVARLREQVQNGTYQTDSKKVAAAFMQELGLV